jgi:C4-dicarboxylate-specific signal transduction histidine kinase
MSQRIKSLLDRIGTLVPGFDGYAKRDDQRRSDKLLRSQIAQTLQKIQAHLEQLMKATLKKGAANELLEMEEIRKACSTISDKINYASYGASSLFDEEQIK